MNKRLAIVFVVLGCVLAIEDLVCMKNHTVMETSGDAVLSVFIDTDYGPDCNISSPKSIQEVATALFVAQSLNKMEFVPGITIGLRLYDTCNDRVAVYKQALISAVEMDCSAHYDLGILAPERFGEVLEPLRSLNIIPVEMYANPNLTQPLIDVLIDFLSTRLTSVDLLLTGSRPVLERVLTVSKEAGICVRSDKELERGISNGTERVVVALGNHEQVTTWLDNQEDYGDEGEKVFWVVLPLDNSYVDDLLPEGSYVIKPEQIYVDLTQDLDTADISLVPVGTIVRSPHLLSIGKAIVEIAKRLLDLQIKSCPLGSSSCVLPRFESEEDRSISNAELYEALHIPAKSHSTRYIVSRKIDGVLTDVAAYKIDATSLRYRVVAEKETPRQSRLCVKKLAKNCQKCVNFLVQEADADDDNEDDEVGTFKSSVMVPIFLTVASCGILACGGVFAFIVYRYFVEDILDGNPALTVCLIATTLLMLTSVVPFCLEDRAVGAEWLNARKIFISSLAFGLAFSVMLTRALFLAFSTKGVFSTQHINGYLQALMLFFMANVEVSLSSMFFALNDSGSDKIMRGVGYIGLLSYDIFLLMVLFCTCCFISQIQRNYHEGVCFFGTAIGLLICWAIWLTCFLLMSDDDRDLIVCYGILGTAYLIILGVLVPRTYFMCEHFTRGKDIMARFEPAELGPDPRINNVARQALDMQSRQPFYDYVNSSVGAASLAQQPQSVVPSMANYYGNASPSLGHRLASRFSLRRRSPEPRRTPGYNNYGFRPEMRELEGAYVIPRLNIEDSDVSETQRCSRKSTSISGTTSTAASAAVPPASITAEARYAIRKSRSKGNTTITTNSSNSSSNNNKRDVRHFVDRSSCVETEVYVQDRLSPIPRGHNEPYPVSNSGRNSPMLTPSHASIREEEEDGSEHVVRVTRF